MSLAVTAVVGTVASVGAAGYSAYAQNKAQKKQAAATKNAANGINFGAKPVAARYKPVDFSREQFYTISDNLRNLRANKDLVTQGNSIIDQDALRRANKFIPGYEQNLRILGNNTNDLLQGRLPYDDVLGLASDRAEIGAALGVPGANAPATFRDLGIKKLEGIQLGNNFLKDMIQGAEAVNPVNRRNRPQDMYLSPLDRIKMRMDQNQLIQQSDQNFNNIAAGLSPGEAAQAQLVLQSNLNAANAPTRDQQYAQYAQLAAGALSSLGSMGGGGGAGGMGSLGSLAGMSSLGTSRDQYGGSPVELYGYKAPAAASRVPAFGSNAVSYRPTGFSLAA